MAMHLPERWFPRWYAPDMRSRPGLWWGLLLVLLCAGFATQSRLSQISLWHDNADQYVANGVPMMTTLDAWYSLRLARLQARGEFVPHGPAPQRHYTRPEPGDAETWYVQREPWSLPLISRMIAALSPLAGGDIDRTALQLAPWLSSLFMLPLFLCLWRLGAPAAGVFGGLVGTFCLAYYRRSTLGWVDTDALTLFFPWLASWLLLLMHRGLSRERLLLLAAATGAVLNVAYLWYPKPVITLLYVGAMVVHLMLAGVPWRRVAACTAVLILVANPLQFVDVLGIVGDQVQRYLHPAPVADSAAGLHFPEVWQTISEDGKLPWRQKLAEVLARPEWAAIGLLACLPFLLRRWRSMAALAPLLALAALALLSSQRFIPYLAPFAGIGWGLLVGLGLRALPIPHNRPVLQSTVACIAAIGVFAIWFAPLTGMGYQPRPAVPAPVFRDLQSLARSLPADTRLWTWWDLGFAIQDATGRGVYHDGSAQYTPQTNLIAASLVNPSQQVLYDTIRFVDREGNRGIRQLAHGAADFDELLHRIGEAPAVPAQTPVHVLFTADMPGKYNAMHTLGTLPRESAAFGIRTLPCTRAEDGRLYCAGQIIDLQSGQIRPEQVTADQPAPSTRLRRVVVVGKEEGVRQQLFAGNEDARLTAEVVLDGSGIRAVYLLDEEAYASNLNQMYLLGRFDNTRFEEVFNDFPTARVFRVRSERD